MSRRRGPYGKYGPAWVALRAARKLEAEGKLEAAEAKYREALALDPEGGAGEGARRGLTSLANLSFHRFLSPRLDATFYCLGAIERFEKMSAVDVRAITLEIAELGRGGFDLTSAEAKYSLRRLPGQFSGLHLVCYMYVGLRKLFPASPPLDVGLDLAAEYELATKLKGD